MNYHCPFMVLSKKAGALALSIVPSKEAAEGGHKASTNRI